MNVFAALRTARRNRPLARRAIDTLPLSGADRVLGPRGASWWQDWMAHAEPRDPWWDPVDYGAAAKALAPTVMTAGWYDIFLPWQLHDFTTARNAGRDVRIVIGPWMHAALAAAGESLRQSIALFRRCFRKSGQSEPLPAEPVVRLYVMGANQWRDYPCWPPPGTGSVAWFLDEHGTLVPKPPTSEASASFDFDPMHPTPSLYGATLAGRSGSGPIRALEARSDVLVFSTEPLMADMEVIGAVSAQIYLRSSTEYTDLYLCLCDVAPRSEARSVCDGYIRLRPPTGEKDLRTGPGAVRKVSVEFWPTAWRFARGHGIRVLLASGAHPRYARNLGSGEPLGDAQTAVVAHQEILFGPAHPSRLMLPVGGEAAQ